MKFNPEERYVGNFTPNDCTIDFYLRVSSLLTENSVVMDLGAGRASWYTDDHCATRRLVRNISRNVKKLVAVDEDPIVLSNRASDEQLLASNNQIDVDDSYFDLIVSDFVFEHVKDPIAFVNEVSRVLKPGGWLCARTPHKYSYPAIASMLLANSRHSGIVPIVQPDRKVVDIFPAYYRLNTKRNLNKYFTGWADRTFLYKVDPAYYFGLGGVFDILNFIHGVTPKFFSGNLLVFLQKPH